MKEFVKNNFEFYKYVKLFKFKIPLGKSNNFQKFVELKMKSHQQSQIKINSIYIKSQLTELQSFIYPRLSLKHLNILILLYIHHMHVKSIYLYAEMYRMEMNDKSVEKKAFRKLEKM